MTMVMMILATAQISADNSQTKEAISCQTIAECEQLAHALETQIGVFKDRGLGNLSREEKVEYLTLKKQLLSTQRKITAKQDEIIVKEKAKTASMLREQRERLDSIQKSLK